MQPDGSVRNRPPNRFEYNDAGQRDVSNTGHGRTRYTYDADGQVIAIRYPGGGFERFERSGGEPILASGWRDGLWRELHVARPCG